MFSLKALSKFKLHKKDTTGEQETVSQDSEQEMLEVTKIRFIQNIIHNGQNIMENTKLWLCDFFKVKRHVIITAICGGIAVVVVAGIAITVSIVNPTDVSTQVETIEEPKAPVLSLYLEAVTDENTITASVYGEDGEILSEHELVFNLLNGSKDDNEEQIEKLKSAYAGQDVEDIEKVVYEDDDKDGTVIMPDLDTGTYTLVVQAEEGYQAPEAAETTIEAFVVMENIMEKVVTDTPVTQKEDPIKTRNDTSASEVVKPVSYVDNAVSGNINVSSVKKSGDNIIYSVKSTKKQSFTEDEISKYKAGTILVEESGTNKQYSGYIYETGTVNVTGGSEAVVTKFIVKNNDIEQTTAQTVKETTAAAETQPVKETGTVNATENSSAGTDKETESSTKAAATQASTENPTVVKTASYTIMEVEPQMEYIYTDGWQNIKGKNYYFENSQAVTGWKNIDGVQYYFNADGSQGSSLVIDVSTYNGDIDWYKVKASGINYAMIRVGYRGYETAKLVLDKRFHNNMSQAAAAGVKVGAYIVTQAVNTAEAVEEASFIVSACRGYNVSLPLAIDVESAGNGSGRGDKISSAERTAVINAFAQTVSSSGYTAMLYANKDWMNNRIYAGNVSCSVWLAQYRSSCTYTGPFAMWQFTDKSRVDGISGDVDMSAWKH